MTPIHRIDIPNAKPEPVADQAGQIVLDALAEAGIDPMKAARNVMMRAMVGQWGRGDWTRAQFIKACRNMLVLNPSLAKDGGR